MAKFVVLGLEGETGLYVVDIDAGTVSPVEAPPGADAVPSTGGGPGPTIRGVNVAVATESREAALSGKLD